MFTPGLRACGYRTASGRAKWPNRDPIGELGGLNLYAYCYNSPINYFDRDGLDPVTGTVIGIGTTVGTGSSGGAGVTVTVGGGAAAVGTGSAVVVGGVVVAGAAAAGLVGYDVYLMNQIHDLNQQNAQAQTAIQIAEQQLAERKAYHRRCDEPPPPNLTGCDLLRWLLQRAKDCVGLRQGYVDKWNDTYKGHRDQIEQRQREIERLEERIKKECQPCPGK